MRVVSNASPLITFARIGRLTSLHKLYKAVQITTEVYNEIVIAGAGMPGAAAIGKADWIQVSPLHDVENLAKAISTTGLGAGEELAADVTLMDEWKGRRLIGSFFARTSGLICRF